MHRLSNEIQSGIRGEIRPCVSLRDAAMGGEVALLPPVVRHDEIAASNRDIEASETVAEENPAVAETSARRLPPHSVQQNLASIQGNSGDISGSRNNNRVVNRARAIG